MRTEVEALKEIRDRLSYFCARLDGKYDPPWVTEVIGIIDDVLIKPHRKDSARIENNMAAHNREKDSYKDTIKPWCDKVGVVKMETNTKENLYEYAVQWRWNGDTVWDVHDCIYQTFDQAKVEVDRIEMMYNRLETRIVRRPIAEWEVVK